MRKSQARRILRRSLATLFDDPATIKVLISDAGIDPASVDFSGSALVIWQDVLIQAEAQNQFESLVTYAADWFPNQADLLRQHYQTYQTARPDLPVPSQKLLLTAGVLLLAIGIIAVKYYIDSNLPAPMPIDGSYNLAVARFPLHTVNGHTELSCISEKVSNWLYHVLLDESKPAIQELVTESRGPDEIGVIAQADPKTVAQQVTALAETINASILIHGVITDTGKLYLLQPEFYIHDTRPSFIYASEIAGPGYLGEAVPFVLPAGITCDTLSLADVRQLNTELDQRVQALIYVVSGLRYLYDGQFDLARSRFEQAIHSPLRSDTSEGQEVLYLLVGAAHLQAYDPTADALTAAYHLQGARVAFMTAISLNPTYQRAFLGLGNVMLEDAKIYNQTGSRVLQVESAKLQEAQAWYTQTLALTGEAIDKLTTAKATLGIGMLHLLGFEHHSSAWSGQQAYNLFQQVLQLVEKEPTATFIMIKAHTYANLGRLAAHEARWTEAVGHYQNALALLNRSDVVHDQKWIARYYSQVGWIEQQQGNHCRALTAYLQALAYGKSALNSQELTEWSNTVDQIKATINGATCEMQ